MAIAPLKSEELLPGEGIILRKNANAVIDVRAAGLSRFAFDDLMWLVGMRNAEAIGGRLYLTNYRLVFKAHRFNRVRGTFSIFLPCVEEVRDSSFAATRQITVHTGTQEFTFVVWGVPRLIGTVDECRSEFDDAYVADLAALAVAEPWKLGAGFRTVTRIESLNLALSALRRGSSDFSTAATSVAGLIDSGFDVADVAGTLQTVELLIRAGQDPAAHQRQSGDSG
ncbi:hypothetical protein ACH4S8_05760 [Streptomyces sp. NPDC021080]|uniref:hypothetical protein n=1 Tax=Streptomyces sp. NPDC021080 TaxID=3365110 RepID=UPI003795D1C2